MRQRVGAPVALGVLLLAVLSVPGRALAGSSQVTSMCDQDVAPGHYACFAERLSGTPSSGRFQAAAAPGGYGPADLSSAYGLSSAPSGAGRRIFVVAAFDDPNAASDLAIYRSTYGLPACTVANGCFKKVNQAGATSPLPALDQGWAGEISLDLDMVSAACPECGITLVEANGSGDELMVATKRATTMGAKYVSLSWGGSDDANDMAYDAAYLRPSGVVYAVATGDQGYAGGATYPATSPYAIAVGGTSLTPASGTSRGWAETAWSGGNSGCTSHETKPAWQASVTTSCSGRAIADVSAVADPATGVAVYDTYEGGWGVFGGTSAATPVIAAIAARAGANGNPDATAYAHPGAFNDVVSGSNAGLCLGGVMCRAGVGWDGPTGLGTPRGTAAFGGTSASSCKGNLLSNSGFESGRAGWSVAAARVHRNAALAHAGSRFTLLDGTGHARTDRLARTVTIPRGCAATLSYYVRVASADRTGKAHDKLALRVNGTTVAMRSNRNRGTHYVRVTLKLTRYAGKRVTLAWVGRENGRLATGFYLDDVKVTLSS